MKYLDLAIDQRVFIDDPLDEALQELDILFNTENCELLGDPSFGSNFEQFLWYLNPSPNALKSYILDRIQTSAYLSKFEYEVEVQVVQGEFRNIYYVVMSIEDPDTHKKKYREYEFR